MVLFAVNFGLIPHRNAQSFSKCLRYIDPTPIISLCMNPSVAHDKLEKNLCWKTVYRKKELFHEIFLEGDEVDYLVLAKSS